MAIGSRHLTFSQKCLQICEKNQILCALFTYRVFLLKAGVEESIVNAPRIMD
jgi:hypothetical protein